MLLSQQVAGFLEVMKLSFRLCLILIGKVEADLAFSPCGFGAHSTAYLICKTLISLMALVNLRLFITSNGEIDKPKSNCASTSHFI